MRVKINCDWLAVPLLMPPPPLSLLLKTIYSIRPWYPNLGYLFIYFYTGVYRCIYLRFELGKYVHLMSHVHYQWVDCADLKRFLMLHENRWNSKCEWKRTTLSGRLLVPQSQSYWNRCWTDTRNKPVRVWIVINQIFVPKHVSVESLNWEIQQRSSAWFGWGGALSTSTNFFPTQALMSV